MDVRVGQSVREGDVLGTVGTTGRSSGPHLHWGVFWGETPLDPLLWLAENDRH
jgi:murein DD-endopeptidase MepM/ murein hydrolase activator NlpD